MEAILKDTRDKMDIIEGKKLDIIKRVRKLIIADNMKPLNLEYRDKKGFVEYYKGVWIRDITSELAQELGLTNLHVMVKNDFEIPEHEHHNQSQTILVRSGKIYNYGTERLYIAGECFFIPKHHNHKLKYFAASQYLITFQPNLVEV